MAENAGEVVSPTETTPLAEEEVNETEGKFLTFPLDDSVYGIEIRHVLEVVIRSTTSKS